jgi:actin-related protein 10
LVSLATLGVSTALVLDVGYKEALSIPVVEGVTVIDAVQYAPLGGKSIHYRIMDELIQRRALLKQENSETVISEPLDEQILEDIKVRTCFVAPFERGVNLSRNKTDFDNLQSSGILSNPADVKYAIDGDKVLYIPGLLRESVCEVLFEMYGDEHTLPTLIIDSILRCPLDVRKQLATNIMVIGGTSMLPGFKHRLINELKSLVKSCRYESRLHFDTFKFHELPCKENYASWLGASIFASNEVITTRSITIDQYLRNNMTISDWCDWIPASG